MLFRSGAALEWLHSQPTVQHVREVSAELSAQSEEGTDHSPRSLIVEYTGDERGMSDLLAQLIGLGVAITRFGEQASDLEDIFMQVTKGVI